MNKSESMKQLWADPEKRAARLKTIFGGPEGREKGYKFKRHFTDDEVRQIRALAASGRTQHSIAEEFGCSQPIISYMVRNITYTHVKGN